MAFDEFLARRVSDLFVSVPGISEKKMFGGVGFMVNGNMACGVHGSALIVRLEPEHYEDMLARQHVQPFDMTGRPMKGWIMVDPAGCEKDADLQDWVQQGIRFAQTLPEKK